MPKLGLFGSVILAGVIAVLIYRKRRQADPLEERPPSPATDAVDEGLKAGIGLVARMREFAHALRVSVGHVLARLRQTRDSIPSAPSDD